MANQPALDSSLELLRSAAAVDWRGPDAYDGLWVNWPKPLVGGRRRRQVFMQLHARTPVDFRRLYRRKQPLIPKALGIFGSVGVRHTAMTDRPEGRKLALEALALLMDDRTAGTQGWGYHWDMQTRWSFYPAGQPNVVVTAFGSAGLLETGEADHAARAQAAARWVNDELWYEPGWYFVYHPGSEVNIHNANLLGAWLVDVAAADAPGAAERVKRAVEETLAGQAADGTWPYGDRANLGWVDSFHTGYVLSCLHRLEHVAPDRIPEALERGTRPYLEFFDPEGRAQLWATRRHPEDAHSAGTGLTTLALLHRRGLVGADVLERVLKRTLDAVVRDGHAVHRRSWWGHSTVHYLRWCDAHVALGLTDVAAALEGAPDHAARSAAQPRA